MKNQKHVKTNGRMGLSSFGKALYETKYLCKKQKQNGMKGGSIIIVDKHEFDIISSDPDDECDCIEIIINGTDSNKCFLGLIYSNDETNMILQGFGYSQTCTTNKRMESGKGTKAMFYALKEYVKKYHPKVNKISLEDGSSFRCLYEGRTINFDLYSYYMLKYGKPYYMKNFEFKFSDKKQEKLYDENLSHIKKNLIINGSILNKYADYMKLRYNVNSDKLTKFNEIVLDKDLKNIVKTDYKPNNKPCCLYLFALIDFYLIEKFKNDYKVQYACFELDI